MIVNKTELSKIFGISQKVISEWHAVPNFPVISTGGVGRGKGNQYETKQVLAWYVNREMNKKFGGNQAAASGMATEDQQQAYDLTVERARLAAAQADKAEIEAELAKGTIIRTTDMLHAWSGHFSSIKAKMRSACVRIARRAETMTEAKAIETMAREQIDDVLREHEDVDADTEMKDEYISKSE